MSTYSFKLPDIGEGIAEAEIVAWHVKVGDRIEEDQQIADMMTDKATVEMESPVAGTVMEVAGEVGAQIAIGSVLVVIETEAEVSASQEGDQTDAALGGSAGETGGDGESHAADIDAGYDDSSDSPTEGESGLDLGR